MTIESIKGSVQRILFQNDATGYKVVRIRLPVGPVVIINGEMGPEMVPGTIATFHGQYKTHPKYGQGFRVSSYEIAHNVEELTSIELFLDRIAPHIGPERAKMIVHHFGKDVIDVLDNNLDRLLEVEGIGKVSAESLAKAWQDNRTLWDESRQEFTLRAFLNSLGIREKRVKRIMNYFGGSIIAESAIRENPYVLAEVEGFGFSTADFVARKLGFPEDSTHRLRAFLFYTLEVSCPTNGHLYFTIEELVQQCEIYCKENNTKFLGRTVVASDLHEVLGSLEADKKIRIDGDAVYGRTQYNFESRSSQLLAEVMCKPSDLISLNREAVDQHIEEFERQNSITLSPEQRQALYYFVEQKVFVITGCPGTGKTKCLQVIVSLINRLHLNLTCMTPTGISAKKMADTVDHDAYTIHRRLGFRGNEWEYGEECKYDTDIAIFDEVSMLDQEVFYRLLAALRDRTHLIFVGDDNQLPSVGAGNVLRELINCKQVPVVRLETIFRQDEASDIIKVAHKIKNGDTDLSLFKPDPTADVFFLRENDILKIEQILIKLAQKFKDERRQFQILSPRNTGPLSVSVLNKILQEILNPPAEGLDEIICRDYILRKGDRIVIKKNDYENTIFNGDVGKIIRIGGGNIVINIDDREVILSVDELEDKVKLAYSLTVHSSQGQEYQCIILPFVNQYGKMMLQRNLLYTAITRAKQKVITIGHGSALERAINNSSVYKRNTKLGERVCRSLALRKSNFIPPQPEEQPSFQPVPIEREQSSSTVEGYSLADAIAQL